LSKLSFDLPSQATAVAFISTKVSQQITTLSPRQQDRLEAEGRFPKSIKLGSGRNGRKARSLAEVLEWNRARLRERDEQ
jgi:predicted DNA-binding transcriptional regulator AlpA